MLYFTEKHSCFVLVRSVYDQVFDGILPDIPIVLYTFECDSNIKTEYIYIL